MMVVDRTLKVPVLSSLVLTHDELDGRLIAISLPFATAVWPPSSLVPL
jgi:hypothetical protein